MKARLVICLAPALFASGVSLAKPHQSRASEEIVLPDISVAGIGVGDKSYGLMLKAIAAFDRRRELAPSATPKFVVAKEKFGGDAPKALNIITDHQTIDLKVDPHGVFALPKLGEEEASTARLAFSGQGGSHWWKPYVRSADLPANRLRFGDLRLECEMRWAVAQEDSVSLPFRVFIEALGGPCNSSSVTVRYFSARPVLEISLIQGERREVLDQHRIFENGHVFAPPTNDQSWSDNATIELKFQ